VGEGLGLGTAGHTVGSAFALQLGSVQGAMAAVSVVLIGVIDNLAVPVFAHLMGL
ncbi:antiholin LrgB, partial [Lactobacillus sp. XV13L]|nr:antiholin LrgB [Lactobacillus sp. XV13L]